jgi:putative FmdB family regulatory protein
MPGYDYECLACGMDFSVFLSIKEMESVSGLVCPHCGSDHVKKKITGFFAKTSRKS